MNHRGTEDTEKTKCRYGPGCFGLSVFHLCLICGPDESLAFLLCVSVPLWFVIPSPNLRLTAQPLSLESLQQRQLLGFVGALDQHEILIRRRGLGGGLVEVAPRPPARFLQDLPQALHRLGTLLRLRAQ